MMKSLLLVVALAAVSFADYHMGPWCYDGCTTIDEFGAGGESSLEGLSKDDRSCSSDTIKRCASGQTCNSFKIKGTGDVLMANAEAAVEGTMKMTHHYCGTADDIISDEICKGIEADMQKGWDNLPEDAGFTVENVKATCDEAVTACSEDCVDMDNHPDWNPHPSASALHQISALLLVALMAVWGM